MVKLHEKVFSRSSDEKDAEFRRIGRRSPTEGIPSVGLRPPLNRFLMVLALKSTSLTLHWKFDPFAGWIYYCRGVTWKSDQSESPGTPIGLFGDSNRTPMAVPGTAIRLLYGSDLSPRDCHRSPMAVPKPLGTPIGLQSDKCFDSDWSPQVQRTSSYVLSVPSETRLLEMKLLFFQNMSVHFFERKWAKGVHFSKKNRAASGRAEGG